MYSRIHHHIFVALLVSILAYSVAAQAQTCLPPVALPAPTEPNIFSEEQEVYLGDAIAEHIQKNYHVIEDVEVTAYLTRIGERLTKHLPLNRLHFQFFLVDLPDANAFVLPGGRIFVSRKLVSAAQTEDELASVMAHELGHLVAHQSAIDTTRLFKEVLGVVKVGDRRDVFDKYNQLIENLRRKPEAFKNQDREKGQLSADQAGLFALVSAGYDVSAMARFWDRITETKGKKGSWFSDLFGSTRPEERRFREMTKAAEAVPANCKQAITANQATDFKQWQAAVDGTDDLPDGRYQGRRVAAGTHLEMHVRHAVHVLHIRMVDDWRNLSPQAGVFRIANHTDNFEVELPHLEMAADRVAVAPILLRQRLVD